MQANSLVPSASSGSRSRSAVAATAIRWCARVCSLFVVGVLSMFAFGENKAWPTPSEWLLLMFFPLGIVVGLVIAWWREVLGACISLASLLVFFGLIARARGSLPANPWLFAVFALPAPMFLLAAALKKSSGVR